jgi:hypothetical protein
MGTFLEKKFSGYVFPINHTSLVGNQDQSWRFLPTAEMIKRFELRLVDEIGSLNMTIQQGRGCPNIKKNLKRYVRQYFGYLSSTNDSILFVSFLWPKKNEFDPKKIDREFIQVFGGCSRYWNIKYNVDEDIFFDLQFNTNLLYLTKYPQT